MAYKTKSRVSAFKMSKTSEPHYTNLDKLSFEKDKFKQKRKTKKEKSFYVSTPSPTGGQEMKL